MLTNEEFQQAKAKLRMIENAENAGLKLSDDWQVDKLDTEIAVMEYRLYLKKKERESWD